ncbi:MAG: hypothetical protein JXQ99_14855 [Hyphomicrobiaceae bacterium]
MADEPDNMVLEMLRADIAELRRDHGQRLSRIEARLANLEESEGRTLTAIGGIHRAHDQLAAKVDRINERLGLADTEA